MITVVFADEAAFRAWHDQACADRGIPFPGYVGDSNVPDLTAQWTTALVSPMIVDGQVAASVTEEQAAADPVLSTLPTIVIKYPTEPGGTVDENGDPASVVEIPTWNWHQPIPPTWLDVETQTTYDTATGDAVG